MVLKSLNDPQVESVLSEPRVARLATVDGQCLPHVSPVWFLFEDGVFWVSTAEDRLKVKNTRLNPKVALVVDTDFPPYRGVIVEGTATLTTQGVQDITRKIAARYSRDPALTFDELMRAPRILMKITPEKVMDIMSYREH
jgi:PPOX class probable F420-dependent enzyme